MFQESLQRALQHVPGTRGAMLIGFDGIPIASLYAEGQSEDSTQLLHYAVEVSHTLRKLGNAALEREMPPIHTISFANDVQHISARVIQGEYLLVLAQDLGTDFARGDLMLKLMAAGVDKELSV